MNIDASPRTLGEIIQTGQHVVPGYQRPYAWSKDNVREFWSDLKSNETEAHFLGSMVVASRGGDVWEVIDGQQRLTTAIIVLAAIRRAFYSRGENQRAEGLSNFITFYHRSGQHLPRIDYVSEGVLERLRAVCGTDIDFSHLNIDDPYVAAGAEIQALIEADLKGRERVSEFLDSMRDGLLDSSVIYARVENRKTAFTIFETLNDRGLSLSQLDLVKNTIFSSFPGDGWSYEENEWTKALDAISEYGFERTDPDDFLGYYWNSRFADSDADVVTVKQIRRSVDAYLNAAENRANAAREFINHFSQSAELLSRFRATLDSRGSALSWSGVAGWREDKYEEIAKRLYGILVTEAAQPLPLLLALMRKYVSGGRVMRAPVLQEFLRVMEVFQFRWSIAQKGSTSSIRRLYRRVAYMVDGSSNASGVQVALATFKEGAKKISPSDAQFKAGLGRLAYLNGFKQDLFKLRHVLRRIEERNANSKLRLEDHLTIEHIEPQAGRSPESPRNFWIAKLGNLMLLPPHVNSTLPNNFAGKSKVLIDWVNPADISFIQSAQCGVWDNAAYKRRQEFLVGQCLQEWSLDHLE